MSHSPLIPPELHDEIIQHFKKRLDGIFRERFRPRVPESIPFPVVVDDAMPKDEIRVVEPVGRHVEMMEEGVAKIVTRYRITGKIVGVERPS